ncbi:EexN family lipoprotein [Desulfurella multipotens]|uniref:EexN family lipoprotein n=1 Tax=Desulfurella multipotens TaxID=79269 RepID=UPI000CBA08EA|nr:EexN family lipoprotein [Desulfurella multipotens]PMP69354.1 MAG: hypothetical protein C0192_00225 [Desulfurella multipotens]
MTKKIKILLLFFVPFLLSACHQYHSKEYYLSHPKKCVERLHYCKQNYGTIMYENQDCKNAYEAYIELSYTNMKQNLH